MKKRPWGFLERSGASLPPFYDESKTFFAAVALWGAFLFF